MNEIYLYKKDNSLQKTINVGLSYPSTYFYGMSVLGYLSLFKNFDTNPNVSAQRIFINSKSLAFEPKYLDLLGFSCIFELDILQILKILKKYGFNPLSKKRRNKTPLIFAGGPVITSNPEPFADFFDFMIIGDGEGIADEIIEVYKKNKKKSKNELLLALSKIKGIYVPSLYTVEYEQDKICSFTPIDNDINNYVDKRISYSPECLYSPIISENTFYSNTVFIELARCCPFECKFCSACWQNKPTRYYDIKFIKKAIKKASKHADKIVFIGAMISAHPNFEEICMYINKLKTKREFKIEFSSMSFEYPIAIVPEIIEEKTISLSIECGSEELRIKSGKNLTDNKIFETIQYYSDRGIEKFNLYFLIGLPEETETDIDKYIEFSLKLADKFKEQTFCHIISSFIPKPQTPYETEKRQQVSILKEYLEKITTAFEGTNISLITPILHNDSFNALISLGDRRLSDYILHIFEKNTPVKNLLKEYKLFEKKYNSKSNKEFVLPHYSKFIYRKKDASEILPWNFIKMQ